MKCWWIEFSANQKKSYHQSIWDAASPAVAAARLDFPIESVRLHAWWARSGFQKVGCCGKDGCCWGNGSRIRGSSSLFSMRRFWVIFFHLYWSHYIYIVNFYQVTKQLWEATMLSKTFDLEKSAPKKTNFTKHLWFNMPFRTHSYPWLFSLSPSHVNEVILGKGSSFLGQPGTLKKPTGSLWCPAAHSRGRHGTLCALLLCVARRGSKSEVLGGGFGGGFGINIPASEDFRNGWFMAAVGLD